MVLVLLGIVVGLASAAEPTYFGLIEVSKAGPDGVVIKFALADDTTNFVKSSGILDGVITHNGMKYGTVHSDIQETNFGMATTQSHPTPFPYINLGRIVLDGSPIVIDTKPDTWNVDVDLTFTTPTGKVMKGHERAWWSD